MDFTINRRGKELYIFKSKKGGIRVMKKLLRLFCLTMILTLAMIGVVSASPSKVKLNKTSATIYRGNTLSLKVTGTKNNITWSTSNKKVATVSSKGKVTAKAKGKAVIKAKVNKKTYSCKVTVKDYSLKSKATVNLGKSYKLKLSGATASKVKWYSSNKKIITVSKGVVKTKAKGTATVSAKYLGKTYKCKIVVKHTNHNYKDIEVVNPTCIDDGYTIKKCVLCGDTIKSDAKALGHDLKEHIDVEATCVNDGIKTNKCERCGYEEKSPIKATGHDYKEEYVTEPTCTTSGIVKYTCNNCGNSYTELAEALGHDFSNIEVTKEATCTDDGLREGKCARCNESIREVIEATGHDFEDAQVTKEPTCTEKGEETGVCINCGKTVTQEIEAIGHDYSNLKTTKEATCIEDGEEVSICNNCGDVIKVPVKALGHAYGEEVITKSPSCEEDGEKVSICANCGDKKVTKIDKLGHNYTESKVTKEATCTEDGEEIGVCTRCNKLSTSVIPALGHNMEITSVVDATCTKDGSITSKCTRCDETSVEVIKATGHDYISEVTKKAKCEDKGIRTYICSKCNDTYTEDIEATGHHFVIVKSVPSTCGSVGYDLMRCDNDGCDYNWDGSPSSYENYYDANTIPDHTWGSWEEIEGSRIPATCTTYGSYKRKRTCLVCGKEEKSDEEIPKDANNHNFSEPSCKENQKCKLCGYEKPNSQLEHTSASPVQENIINPTCTTDGSYDSVVYCSVCGTKISSEHKVTKALGHDFNNYVYNNNATCQADGTETSKCSRCDVTDTRIKSGSKYADHQWVDDTSLFKAVNCTEDGYKVHTCKFASICGQNQVHYDIQPALGHNYVEDRKEATCTKKGYQQNKCSRCGSIEPNSYKDLPLLAHDYDNFYKCRVCGQLKEYSQRVDIGETSGYIVADIYNHNNDGSYDVVVRVLNSSDPSKLVLKKETNYETFFGTVPRSKIRVVSFETGRYRADGLKIKANADSSYLFSNLGSQKISDLYVGWNVFYPDLSELIDFSNVTSANYMFYNTYRYLGTNLNIAGSKGGFKLPISKIINASHMFENCRAGIVTMDNADWNALQDGSYMFSNMGSSKLIFKNNSLNSHQLWVADYMFAENTGLSFDSINLASAGPSSGPNYSAKGMFSSNTNLTIKSLSSSLLLNTSYMFTGTSNISILALSLPNVTNASYMFSNCDNSKIPSIDIPKATSFEFMFAKGNNLDFSECRITASPTNLNSMFSYYTSSSKFTIPLISDYSKVTNFKAMFANCNINGIMDLSTLRFSNSSADYTGMFSGFKNANTVVELGIYLCSNYDWSESVDASKFASFATSGVGTVQFYYKPYEATDRFLANSVIKSLKDNGTLGKWVPY